MSSTSTTDAAVLHRLEGEGECAAALVSTNELAVDRARRGRSRTPARARSASCSTACRPRRRPRRARAAEAPVRSMSRRQAEQLGRASGSTPRRGASASNMHRPCGMLLSAVSKRLASRLMSRAGDHRIEQRAAQPVGDELQRRRRTATSTQAKIAVVGAADEQQRQRHRNARRRRSAPSPAGAARNCARRCRSCRRSSSRS